VKKKANESRRIRKKIEKRRRKITQMASSKICELWEDPSSLP
jgi:hypothetical protein